MLYRVFIALFIAFLVQGTGSFHLQAQELNCSVSVNYSQLSGTDFSFLDDLENQIEAYLNEYSWTDDRFQDYERISCSMQIIIQEATSLTEFEARLVVATLRPIYGTRQTTPVVRLNDSNWRFSYARGSSLQHNIEQYNPLTSMLDYYAYLILGYDYDTFSQRGGTPYFEEARRIAELARTNGGTGWSSVGGSDARTALIAQLLDDRYHPLRDAYFKYHLQGLDRFLSDTEQARETIFGVLESLDELNDSVSRSYAIDTFFSAKYQELAALFDGAQLSSQAYGLLSQLDPAHTSEYDQLR